MFKDLLLYINYSLTEKEKSLKIITNDKEFVYYYYFGFLKNLRRI